MTRARTALIAATSALLAGCGIQPTGVLDGGQPASGIPRGMRVYFASNSGLHAVPRPDARFDELTSALKLVVSGPNPTERTVGLTNLVHIRGPVKATAEAGRVTLDVRWMPMQSLAGMATGQLVCTLSQAEFLLHGTRPDTVQVTINALDKTAGPYQCPQFLTQYPSMQHR